ncbi:orotate phosphoribosyltransferase [Pediococcus claussenii]|uniref:Orotate phosphoribosyltransferase n=1 Tax=Pediococcus claussenii (strain ATCC BAA-344 / DSM 14800 / JCM 18046 / KCTC 3811 / LMG 21948 / P06) TaxID=701521 RepID=G8PBN1_PEDCP|nr:orotate phosphoribosyltransferase [Pediococcus claussenii]AEV94780.1 orotate phosphoribosyltransferase [Pediococcus claussenii ATCC BAA-344]ANZ69976.1 orotate phosphoribosyltransferase [Pediococcus claussenii]ANZ71792.1 orotate phosphoribosyltransferase [Pediococcus claussenii]KRN20959.1 pyrE protein [Pediococcus claussenii]
MNNLELKILKQLLEIKAITINPQNPFTYASGIHSPIYTDLRQTISYPELRHDIAQGLSEVIKEFFPEATVIGGVATAGIPHAAWVAELMELPMIYVRSKPKDHGAGRQIEGRVSQDDSVVLIDDLISTGGSVLKAAEAVNSSGAKVIGVTSIFSYGLVDAKLNFKEEGVTLKSLLDFKNLVELIKRLDLLSLKEVDLVEKWHSDPWNWK